MNRSLARGVAAFAAVVAIVTAAPQASANPTAVKVFHLQHTTVLDASKAVQPMLSETGSITLHPHRSRITVQDSPEVVAAIAARLRELDTEPERFRIEVELIKGTDQDIPLTQQAQIPARARRMYPFRSYRRFAVAVFDCEVGTPSSAVLGGHYRVSFLPSSLGVSEQTPWGIPDPGSRIHLEWLTLERIDGEDGDGKPVNLLQSSGFLSREQEIVTGIGQSEDAKTGLVLVLRSRPLAAE